MIESDDGATRQTLPSTYREPLGASMRGRVCVVTGATRGIGKATALGLARLGATVVAMARDRARGDAAVAEIQRESDNPAVSLVVADLASLASIRAAATEIERRVSAVHVLVNNAGVSVVRRQLSADGIEMTLAVNHLAPFYLTRLLTPLLRAGAPDARVVTVSSELERWGRIDFGDLQGTRRYGATRAYLQSKLANVMFTYDTAERLRPFGVAANCVYPGLVASDLLRERWWWRARWLTPLWRRAFLSRDEGAAASIFAASAPSLRGITGQCFDRRGREVRTSRRSYDGSARRRLWLATEQLYDVAS